LSHLGRVKPPDNYDVDVVPWWWRLYTICV